MGLLPEPTKELSNKFKNDILNQILAICWVCGWLLHNLAHMVPPIGMGELVGCDHLVAMSPWTWAIQWATIPLCPEGGPCTWLGMCSSCGQSPGNQENQCVTHIAVRYTSSDELFLFLELNNNWTTRNIYTSIHVGTHRDTKSPLHKGHRE